MAAASTGRARTSKTAVIATDQTNRGRWRGSIAFGRMFLAVVMKLILAKIEETPAK